MAFDTSKSGPSQNIMHEQQKEQKKIVIEREKMAKGTEAEGSYVRRDIRKMINYCVL